MRFLGLFWSKTPDFLVKIGCQWSYWPDLNRRPADYERSYLDFSLAAPGFSELFPRLSRKNQQVNYPVSAFSSVN